MAKKKAFTPLLYLASIVFLPWWISLSFDKSLKSWITNWWDPRQSETFLNGIQEKSVLEQFIEVEELFLLDEMIKECSETHLQKLRIGIQKETIQLIKLHNEDHIHTILHFSTNLICFVILSGYSILGNEELIILNSWGYENPREATRRIVCANCHLANKPVDIEFPQPILPDIVFEAVVTIPYNMQLKQVLAYGENRGRGQIYPDENKSNNIVYNATTIEPELLVLEGESTKLNQPLTINPDVGGFGQGDIEIVLQDPLHVQGLLFFLASIVFVQILLVLKKKQFEKVQVSEMNF
ncbi:hypothetical protein Gotur_033265 [Gossypium turneri]